MEMIPQDTKCKLSVTPANTTLWEKFKDVELKAHDKVGACGNQQFIAGGTAAIYANNGNGFLVEPL